MAENKKLLYFLVFVVSFIVHIIGLNLIGRTWDEEYKTDMGAEAWNNIFAADFSANSWYDGIEHPMVAKYIYGYGMLTQVIPIETNGIPVELSYETANELQNGNYIKTSLTHTVYAVPYDFVVPRVISALFSAGTVLLTVILADYILGNIWWSMLAGGFLLLNPRFVFLGQLVTFESLSIFFFCFIIYLFKKLLENPKKLKLYFYVGLISGLFFWTRYNNIIFLPFLSGWLFLHYQFYRKKEVFSLKLIIIPLVAFIFGVVIWPLLWHSFPKYLLESLGFHENRLYISLIYWRNLIVETPIPILFGAILGIYFAIRKRSYLTYLLLWALVCIVVFYTIFCIPEGGTRYISIIFPPITILSAFGYFNILKQKFVYILIPIILFLLYEQIKIFPYYLDYYNQFVGGTAGASKNGYTFSGWGEGQREVGLWINNNVPNGSTIGLIVTPHFVFPRIRLGLHFEGYVDEKNNSDYIVVSKSDLVKLSKSFYKNHTIVYSAKADGIPLVFVFKRE